MSYQRIFLVISWIYFSNCDAQVIDLAEYVIPNQQHFSRDFSFESGVTINENGRHQNKMTYSYSYSELRKQYVVIAHTISTSSGHESGEMGFGYRDYWDISHQEVFSTDYVSDHAFDYWLSTGKWLFPITGRGTVIKQPPSQWKDKSGNVFHSIFGNTTTKWGNYPDCVVVIESRNSSTSKKIQIKNYYCRGLGLVNSELYVNGVIQGSGFWVGALVDDFSEHSFTVQRHRKKQVLEQNQFLSERATKTYSLSELEPTEFERVMQQVEKRVETIVSTSRETQLRLKFSYNLSVDLFGDFENAAVFEEANNLKLKEGLTKLVDEIRFAPPIVRGMTINTWAILPFEYRKAQQGYSLVKSGKQIRLTDTSNESSVDSLFQKMKQTMESGFYPLGKYEVTYSESFLNGKVEGKLHVDKHRKIRGQGGAGYGLLSLVVPGLGDYFVSRRGSLLGRKTPPAITTVLALGGIGSGIYLRTLALQNHDNYRSAVTQSAINQYYECANAQHYASIALIATGSAFWLADIIYVFAKGANNTKKLRAFKQKHNLAFGVTPTYDGMALSSRISF